MMRGQEDEKPAVARSVAPTISIVGDQASHQIGGLSTANEVNYVKLQPKVSITFRSKAADDNGSGHEAADDHDSLPPQPNRSIPFLLVVTFISFGVQARMTLRELGVLKVSFAF